MEAELQFLREEVRAQSSSVHRLQQALYDQQVRANTTIIALRSQLIRSGRRHRLVQRQKQQRLADTLSDLLLLEGRLQQEQRQVLQMLHDKDDLIQRQRWELQDLSAQNDKLTVMLTQAQGRSLKAHPPSQERGDEVEVERREPEAVVMRSKEPRSRVHFGSLKDTLKRHKSSQELHRPRSMETLLEVRLCNSQEYLSDGGLLPDSSGKKRHNSAKGHKNSKRHDDAKDRDGVRARESSKHQEDSKRQEGSRKDKGKKSKHKERQEKCVSLVEQSSRLLGLPDVSPGGRDKDQDGFSLPVPLFRPSRTHSPARPKRDHSPSPCTAAHTYSQDSLNSDEEPVLSSSHGDKQYGELAKASSMPLTLTSRSEKSDAESSLRPRPRSLPGEGLNLHVDPLRGEGGVSSVSMNPSPTSLVPPGQHEPLTATSTPPPPPAAAAASAESSPFQSLKNVFRRRSTKQRSKKRPVSMGQPPSQEFHAALKEHFKKYDLS